MNDQIQLGFADFLTQAETDNRQHRFLRETDHLPDTMAEAVPRHRLQIRQHHAAMLAGDIETAMQIRQEAHRMACRVNGGDRGILAGDDAPGNVLGRRCAAQPGKVPLWGQSGTFIVTVDSLPVSIEMQGIFGICSSSCPFPGFHARVVDRERPFISGTGFRSFLGIYAELVPGLTPDSFVHTVIEGHISRELKGKLRPLEDISRH